MIITLAFLDIKPECVDAFITASTANAQASRQEPGVTRFDLVRQLDVPTNFTLVEEYRDIDAVEAHRTTEHYLAWKATVADMQATPRHSHRYQIL
ncbi:putative quinol monooxygenase [Acidipropionibacterium jensenii]|uniref:Antibiotic biosynthesis monooxygenase n=1 Tax=Acidipropionibacterium jensenii TaxID=1749 RepID=A0A3T0RXG2_9ACTN|nr:putative quinol monooxygenase [Acidipropionibacterium jensenii]AZZ38836.1 antibiotic biosynthesis monooxygenase [Acidipropionibacterium jensenii]MDN5976522.1 antibiotic biosynthesis monooxygenase [Acidipropionibacterium jensenii]MDN5995085.1 antibiotic biosynthesis monooxygenase [Acidipropionibacterium jensenii]MDN6425995.1 antibiotic biosynthesis monooxygenase [Acidipropionibacterium jensenii]MDN6440588.1 antibiotic biosynthesis monooxygenase [Acidipropionibacterium jensenii]